MSIHNNLRQLRLYSGMTQEQAAGKLGVARQTLSSYESGRTRPDIDMLVRLCDIYETDLDGMIYGQNRTLKAVQRVKKSIGSKAQKSHKLGLTIAGRSVNITKC